jgi:hypothetical protein
MIDVTRQYVGMLKPLSQNIWIDQDEWAAFGRFFRNAKTEPQSEKMIVLLVRAILCGDDRTTWAVVQMGRDLLDRKGSVSNLRTGI